MHSCLTKRSSFAFWIEKEAGNLPVRVCYSSGGLSDIYQCRVTGMQLATKPNHSPLEHGRGNVSKRPRRCAGCSNCCAHAKSPGRYSDLWESVIDFMKVQTTLGQWRCKSWDDETFFSIDGKVRNIRYAVLKVFISLKNPTSFVH